MLLAILNRRGLTVIARFLLGSKPQGVVAVGFKVRGMRLTRETAPPVVEAHQKKVVVDA